jgi:hypothetical protein
MNESILEALMRLFALVAYVNEKGQPNIERSVVKEYLQRQYASELVEKYLVAFDNFLTEYHPDLSWASDAERRAHSMVNSLAVKELCDRLNEELESEQKNLYSYLPARFYKQWAPAFILSVPVYRACC